MFRMKAFIESSGLIYCYQVQVEILLFSYRLVYISMAICMLHHILQLFQEFLIKIQSSFLDYKYIVSVDKCVKYINVICDASCRQSQVT